MQYNNEIGSVSFRLKDPKLETSRIAGRYSFKDYQIDFSTGIKIPTIHWDKNKQYVSSGASKKEINLKLDKFRASIIDTHNRFNEQYNRIPTKEELKSIVNSAKEGKDIKVVKKGKKSFDDIFEEFMEILKLKNNNAIDSGQKPKHKSYISSFNVMYKDLKEFAKETNTFIDIDKFDEVLCLKFQSWLINSKKLCSNTVKTRIKRLSQVLRKAFEKGYTDNRSYLQEEFKPKVAPSFNVVLTEKDITELYQYDLSNNKRLEKIRDLFVLGCHTSLRFGDITRIENSHIDYDNKKITILSEKVSTNDKYTTLCFSFFGYTEEILKKYNGNIKSISISNQKTNDYLKEVFEEIPYFKDKKISIEKPTNKGVIIEELSFSEKIAFHDSRRSFCTNRYIEGWDLLEIWQYTGHTNENTFKTYFKPTSEHEQLRQESIKSRNEKLQKYDLQSEQIRALQEKIEEMSKKLEQEEQTQNNNTMNIA